MFFDTHAHYDADAFDEDREELLCSLPSQGVDLVLNPGCDVETSRKAVSYAEKYPHVYAAVGIHPSECGGVDLGNALGILKDLAETHEKVRAIGEIGLDFYWDENPSSEEQHSIFRGQMSLAETLKLPVIIHDREAHEPCLKVVEEYKNVTGVYHCYSGSVEYSKILVNMGYMLSFTGVITYKNARKTLEVLDYLPLDRIMLETDSPYLTPVPFRGKRNDSTKLVHTAQVLADVKGISLEECGRITTENGKRFFQI